MPVKDEPIKLSPKREPVDAKELVKRLNTERKERENHFNELRQKEQIRLIRLNEQRKENLED